MTFDREKALAAGVKRGALIDFSLIVEHTNIPQQIIEWVGNSEAYGIISLYDCALIDSNTTIQGEPWVHLLIAKKIDIESIKGNFTYGKNSRVIHFSANIGGNKTHLECSAIGVMIPIDRNLLPDPLSPKLDVNIPDLHDLFNWSCDRIVKAVFSDEFNGDVKKGVEKAFNDARMKNITSVLVKFNEDDLEKKQYPVQVTIALTTLDSLSPDDYQALEAPRKNVKNDLAIADKVANAFHDITVEDESGNSVQKYNVTSFIISEGELPYNTTREYKKWSTDSLTLKEKLDTTAPTKNGNYD